MCQILPKGVVSVIGPASSPASGSTISHICGEKEVSNIWLCYMLIMSRDVETNQSIDLQQGDRL